MNALMATDLPLPVDPAISRCGIEFISVVIRRPLMSLPSAMVSFDFEAENSGLSTTSRSQMVSRFSFGTWMPTVDFPATRSIRMLSARMARQRSSCKPTMRLYLMPASGLNSKVVTTGPGLICTTAPSTPNSAHFWVRVSASSFNSCSS